MLSDLMSLFCWLCQHFLYAFSGYATRKNITSTLKTFHCFNYNSNLIKTMFCTNGPKICKSIFDVHGTVHRQCIPLSLANKMQRSTIFFIAVNALHVSGGFSAHHQELKLYTQHLVSGLLAATTSVGELEDTVCTV
jgi:hypothetical protein